MNLSKNPVSMFSPISELQVGRRNSEYAKFAPNGRRVSRRHSALTAHDVVTQLTDLVLPFV
jgi:hypothetical protein